MLALSFALWMSAAANGAERKTTYVEVDGARYRVTTTGNEVEVTRKAFAVRYTIAERDRLRQAVRKADGMSHHRRTTTERAA